MGGRPPRAHVRTLFLRLLGLCFLVAFLSILAQVGVLFGSRGLLPAQQLLNGLRPSFTLLEARTVFWINCSDTALHGVAILGAVVSVALICNLAPRYTLIALWGLYLSFATIGQTFFGFQWDNLLLESAFFAVFITPPGLRPRNASPPHPIAIFLMQWLVFRLHVESGLAKLLSGDPTWRNLTAMVNYYETAPLPTWVGWYAHQMPLWGHQFCALFTFVVELVVPFLMWGPRRLRVAAFALMIAMQVSVILTGNYGFFNYLSMALCLFVIDDGHLRWMAQRISLSLPAAPPRPQSWLRTAPLAVVAPVLVLFSIGLFLPWFRTATWLDAATAWTRSSSLNSFRSINTYHLFATMTLVRREAVVEGSDDGAAWLPYEFRYKPGDPSRAPPFVAPHQPRVDFQLWFLLLSGLSRAQYFHTLLVRLFDAPDAVAPLFSHNPFPNAAPRYLRVAFYRYTFTDWPTRHATGAWWQRELLGYSDTLSADSFRR